MQVKQNVNEKVQEERIMQKKYADFKLGVPDYVTVETEEERLVCQGGQTTVAAGATTVEFQDAGEHEDIFVTSEDAVRCVKLRWNYKIPKSARFLGDAWERTYGDAEWHGMSGNRYLPWYFLAKLSEKVLCFGVKVRPSAMCCWQVDTKGITLFLDVRCGNTGVQLKGRKLCAAQIVGMEAEGADTFETAQKFCEKMCTDPIFPEFPVYGSNNWYYAYGDSSEEEILSDTDYILKLTEGVKNPPFMVIDDCWQEHHRLDEYNGGPWTKGNARFPDMKGLADKLEKKGVRPGIWVRLLLNEDENIPDEWRISYNDCLDPSHPDALEYIRKDIERICDWGYTLIKHDFSTFDLFGKWGFEANLRDNSMEKWHFYDQTKTSAEIVKMLYQEIYDASRSNNAVIIGCNTIGHLGAGLMHLNRTGDDTSGRIWERTRRMGVNTLAFRLPQHNTFYHIDADCVGIFGMIPWEKNRQWADVLAKSGTPLFVSAKPGVLNPEEFEELHQIMLRASEQKEHFVPLDWEEIDCPEVWGENGETITYDWFDNEGPTMDATVEYYNAKVVVP